MVIAEQRRSGSRSQRLVAGDIGLSEHVFVPGDLHVELLRLGVVVSRVEANLGDVVRLVPDPDLTARFATSDTVAGEGRVTFLFAACLRRVHFIASEAVAIDRTRTVLVPICDGVDGFVVRVTASAAPQRCKLFAV